MRLTSVIAGIVVALLAVTLWRFTQPAPHQELRLTQLTFDPGLATDPTISADGRTLAYVSDREGATLALYVQQLPNGTPRRVFETSFDISQPALSPDGLSVAYRSSRDGGGLYLLPPSAPAVLLAAGGGMPRFSPDGRYLAFTKQDGAYLVAATGGGTPRRFHGDLPAQGALAWSPDSRSLLFWAKSDLWVAPLEGGSAESTGVLERIDKADLGPGPFDDLAWTSEGLLFSARTGFVRNLYLCPLTRDGKASGDVRRVTNGTELMGGAAVSREGRLILASSRQRFDVWALPLNANRGVATGPLQRLTDTLAPTATPVLSADGRELLYGASRNGFTEVWRKDLVTGKESVAATGPEGASYGRWLGDSKTVVYLPPHQPRGETSMSDRKLAVDARPWDVDHAKQTMLLSGEGIDAMDLATGKRSTLLRPPPQTVLSQASFSPDDRWVLFLAEDAAHIARIYVAPCHGGEWLPVTDGTAKVDKPRFSPDGKLIYFTEDDAGSRVIRAVAFDPANGRPAGQPFQVFRSPNARLSLWAVHPQALEISVAVDKLAMILCETTSTIWMGDLVPRH